jgi:hypothetical protein
MVSLMHGINCLPQCVRRSAAEGECDDLTGSDQEGRFSTAGRDTTCGNWTESGEGSAIVGHHDLQGLKDTRH